MTENSEKVSRLDGKKRFIAVAALIGLVAAGGGIGAAVTHEMGINDNSIQYTDKSKNEEDKKKNANVAITGDPLKVTWDAADTETQKSISWTVKNTGDAPATINGLDIPGSVMGPGRNAGTHWNFTAIDDASGKVLVKKDLAHDGKGTTKSMNIDAGGTKTITARVDKPVFGEKDADILRNQTFTYDVKFDWIKSGETSAE